MCPVDLYLIYFSDRGRITEKIAQSFSKVRDNLYSLYTSPFCRCYSAGDLHPFFIQQFRLKKIMRIRVSPFV